MRQRRDVLGEYQADLRRRRTWLDIDRDLRAETLTEDEVERAARDLHAALPGCSMAYSRRWARDGVTVEYLVERQQVGETWGVSPHEEVHGEQLASEAERRVGLRYESGRIE